MGAVGGRWWEGARRDGRWALRHKYRQLRQTHVSVRQVAHKPNNTADRSRGGTAGATVTRKTTTGFATPLRCHVTRSHCTSTAKGTTSRGKTTQQPHTHTHTHTYARDWPYLRGHEDSARGSGSSSCVTASSDCTVASTEHNIVTPEARSMPRRFRRSSDNISDAISSERFTHTHTHTHTHTSHPSSEVAQTTTNQQITCAASGEQRHQIVQHSRGCAPDSGSGRREGHQ